MNNDKTTLPGTGLTVSTRDDQAFETIRQILRVTGGITLAQLVEITGLEATTIQNWVKRGWVDSPKNRRYKEASVARIIIINMLRSSLQLSSIVELMAYVNGLVGDRSDDIIPDSELYNLLCSITDEADKNGVYNEEGLKAVINAHLTEYTEPFPGAGKKLRNALLVMAIAYISSQMKQSAIQILEQITNENSTANGANIMKGMFF